MSRLLRTILCLNLSLLFATPGFAETLAVDDATIALVSVNGGADTANPGTTCLVVSRPVSAACPGGFVAIQNNNKELIAATLQAKTSGAKILLYYDNSRGPFHCPQFVFTPCSVTSIVLK